MKRLGYSLLTLALCYNAFGQSQILNEGSVRIDPEWFQFYRSESFISSDLYLNEEGQIYIAGTFLNYLLYDSLVREHPRGTFRESSANHYFIANHNEKGKLLWINFANGKSRISKLIGDKEGNIYTTGEAFGHALEFTSTDGTSQKLNKPADAAQRGLYIAKYNSAGKLLKTTYYTHNQAAAPADLKIDNDGNLLLCGNFTYRNDNELISNYLLLKFDKDLQLIWEKQGTAKGRSYFTSLAFDRYENIYCTGSYSGHIAIENQVYERDDDEYQHIFVTKFDKHGDLEWFETFPENELLYGTSSTGVKIALGKWRHLYVTGNLGQRFFLMKLNRWHRVNWLVSGRERTSYIGDLIVQNNQVHVAGYGHGTRFEGTDEQSMNYQSQGSTDFFVSKYNRKGELLWLQAGGGAGTDYAKALALHKGSMYLLGHNLGGLPVVFKDLQISNRQPVFWLAKFDLAKLE